MRVRVAETQVRVGEDSSSLAGQDRQVQSAVPVHQTHLVHVYPNNAVVRPTHRQEAVEVGQTGHAEGGGEAVGEEVRGAAGRPPQQVVQSAVGGEVDTPLGI